MFCPNCGNKTSTDHKFCRSCGLGLEKIADSLAELLPTKLNKSLQSQKDKLERLGMAALSVFGLGALSLLAYGIGYKLMVTQGRILAGLAMLGFVVLIGCGLLSVYLFARANEVKEASGKRRLEQPAELTGEETTKELLPEAIFQPISSVTDRTTELLLVEQNREGTRNAKDN